MDVLPQRVNELAEAVKLTPGFEAWQPDCTPASLDALGQSFAGQRETCKRTDEELQATKDRLVFPMGIASEELTKRTFSLAMDLGMYLSQVFLNRHPSLKWEQPLENKSFIDYGPPVLVGFGSVPFNPVRMVVTFAYGLVSKKKTGDGLRNIYSIWFKLVQTAS